jgi:hypothetical protein
MEMDSLEENETGSEILPCVQQRRHQSTNARLALACQFCNVIVGWGACKIAIFGATIALDGGMQSEITMAKIFGSCQNFWWPPKFCQFFWPPKFCA